MVLTTTAGPALATDHFNLESGIPTTLEDIEPTETGTVELQSFGRYLRARGGKNVGQLEPRIAWGVVENTQIEVATPLVLGEGAANGNGDVRIGVLRKLWDDRTGAWWPGVALAADVTLPTGLAQPEFTNSVDAGFTVIMKKDAGPHSFHFNAGFDWTADEDRDGSVRSIAFDIIVGHDMPLTDSLLLVSDVVWRQADDRGAEDIWSLESGVRAQVASWLIGAFGLAVGLNGGSETPVWSLTVGFQIGPGTGEGTPAAVAQWSAARERQ